MKVLMPILVAVFSCWQFNAVAGETVFESSEFSYDVFGNVHNVNNSSFVKPVVLVFFEPYSGYGLAQANALFAKFNEHFVFYGIAPAMNSTSAIAAKSATQHHVKFPVFFDKNNTISRQLKAWQHPGFVVFDQQGNRISKQQATVEEITAQLNNILDQSRGG